MSKPSPETPSHGPAPTHRVRHPIMRMRWEALTFLHWSYAVEEVQALLPAGIQVEPWEGKAWVGLVPLYMRVRPPVGPAITGLTTFAETTVRTYVTGPTGEPGVWFFSLDAANPPAVAAGRAAFGLPYFLSKMELTREGDKAVYRSRRAGRQPDRASHRIEVEAGDEIAQSDLGDFDHYLTARFRLWSVNRGAVMLSDQEHAPLAVAKRDSGGARTGPARARRVAESCGRTCRSLCRRDGRPGGAATDHRAPVVAGRCLSFRSPWTCPPTSLIVTGSSPMCCRTARTWSWSPTHHC